MFYDLEIVFLKLFSIFIPWLLYADEMLWSPVLCWAPGKFSFPDTFWFSDMFLHPAGVW